MSEHTKVAFDVGPGLFRDEAVEVPIEFPAGVARFKMKPLTASLIAQLEAEGIKVDDLETGTQAIELSTRIVQSVVHGWRDFRDVNGDDIPYTEENRDTLATVPVLVAVLWKAAAGLAVQRQEAEEGNSES